MNITAQHGGYRYNLRNFQRSTRDMHPKHKRPTVPVMNEGTQNTDKVETVVVKQHRLVNMRLVTQS